MVLDTWKKDVIGSDMHHIQLKFLSIKDAFRVWNKYIFGDVQRQVTLADDEVARIQALIDVTGLDVDLHAQELQAQLSLTRATNCQDQFWR